MFAKCHGTAHGIYHSNIMMMFGGRRIGDGGNQSLKSNIGGPVTGE
jgi:hypothetical protein